MGRRTGTLETISVTIDVFQVVAIILSIILAAYGEVSWWIPVLFLLWGMYWEVTFRFTREGGKNGQ